jgi:hypothetical protein
MDSAADIFRVTLLARRHQALAEVLRHKEVGNGCRGPVTRRDDGLYAAVVFVSATLLRHLTFLADVQLGEAHNLSARMRLLPEL